MSSTTRKMTTSQYLQGASLPQSNLFPQQRETAIVYCEGYFGENTGKTANGLIRESNRFHIISIIDSTKAGQDSGLYLNGIENGIPICSSLSQAISIRECIPEYFIYGLAPDSGHLTLIERQLIHKAMRLGMNIVIGLHEFLNEDPEFVETAKKHHVKIVDIRKPRPTKDLKIFSNRIQNVHCPRILVMGTDCAIGKRTTALALTRMLKNSGLNAVMIATGQTGLIQGSSYGVALDAVPSQYCVGELEAVIVEAYENEKPDVIVIEGQGALSHPSFCTSASIIRGSQPTAIILQHSPMRVYLSGSEEYLMPELGAEIDLIEHFSGAPVIGITLNNTGMDEHSIRETIFEYSNKYQVPVTELFTLPNDVLVNMVLDRFPELDVV
ncbi:DUF1611 domain-containing protein [Vibrio cholerae]